MKRATCAALDLIAAREVRVKRFRLTPVLLVLAGCGTAPVAKPSPAEPEPEPLNLCVLVVSDERGGAFDAFKAEQGDNVWEIGSPQETGGCDVVVRLSQNSGPEDQGSASAVAVSAHSQALLTQASAVDAPENPATDQVAQSLLAALSPGNPLYTQVDAEREKYRSEHPAEPETAPSASAASGGLSKEDIHAIVKQAVAQAQEGRASTEAAPEPQIQSDVDTPTYSLAPSDQRFAVVVGIENYADLPAASYAQRDAEAVSSHLLAMGWPQRNIILLTNERATKAGLTKNLESWLAKVTGPEAVVFFYFSGHGAPDPQTGQAYLVPWDGDAQYLEDSAYPVKRLYEKLGALKARRIVAVLDSCFSGGGGRSLLARGARPLVNKVELGRLADDRIVSLTAAAADQITGAFDEQGHGLFTYYFLKGLSEKGGKATFKELYDYLVPRVQDEARRQHREQTPQLGGKAARTLFK